MSGQRVGELSGLRLGGVERPHQRKGQGWVLKIAIHLEEHEAFRYSKRNPRGPKWGMWPRVPSVPTFCVAPGSAAQDAVLPVWGGRLSGADS